MHDNRYNLSIMKLFSHDKEFTTEGFHHNEIVSRRAHSSTKGQQGKSDNLEPHSNHDKSMISPVIKGHPIQ